MSRRNEFMDGTVWLLQKWRPRRHGEDCGVSSPLQNLKNAKRGRSPVPAGSNCFGPLSLYIYFGWLFTRFPNNVNPPEEKLPASSSPPRQLANPLLLPQIQTRNRRSSWDQMLPEEHRDLDPKLPFQRLVREVARPNSVSRALLCLPFRSPIRLKLLTRIRSWFDLFLIKIY